MDLNLVSALAGVPVPISDPAVVFSFSVFVPPASLPRPLSPRGREGRKTKESFFFIPSSPRGRGGVGEVRGGGAATLK